MQMIELFFAMDLIKALTTSGVDEFVYTILLRDTFLLILNLELHPALKDEHRWKM